VGNEAQAPRFNDGFTLQVFAWGTQNPLLLKPRKVARFVEGLALFLHLTPITPVLLHKFPESGVTGIALGIAESHIAAHTWPEHNAIRIMIDSCKLFSKEDALYWIQRKLKPTHIHSLASGGPRGYFPWEPTSKDSDSYVVQTGNAPERDVRCRQLFKRYLTILKYSSLKG
jgi:S-adenosylmethionine decarboxylase